MTKDNRRTQMARNMRARQKRNSYTNSSERERFWGYPKEGDPGSSDCSSAVRKAIQRVTGFAIGSNTVSQVNNNTTLEWIEFANGKRYPTVALMPGDLLYFKGTDKSRPYMVGHVEMVDEDTAYLWGHGSGIGPRRIKLKDYCDSRYKAGRGLIGVKRVVLPGEISPPTDTFGDRRILKLTSPIMTGPDVRELQENLKELNFDCSGIDGKFGPNTKAALIGFQHANKLSADGEYGPLTHAALVAALLTGDPDDPEDEAPTPLSGQIVATGDVWIRTLPSATSARVTVLYKGKALERNGEDTESWYGVLYNGQQRYVSKKYAKVV